MPILWYSIFYNYWRMSQLPYLFYVTSVNMRRDFIPISDICHLQSRHTPDRCRSINVLLTRHCCLHRYTSVIPVKKNFDFSARGTERYHTCRKCLRISDSE